MCAGSRGCNWGCEEFGEFWLELLLFGSIFHPTFFLLAAVPHNFIPAAEPLLIALNFSTK